MKYTAIDVTIANGISTGSNNVVLEPGRVTNVALFKNGVPTSGVDVGISTKRGDEIHPLVPYQEFEPTGGSHQESRKRIDIAGNTEIKVLASSKEVLSAEWTFTMLFTHED